VRDVQLARVAEQYGVATSYEDWRGRRVPVDPDVIRHVLAALGADPDREPPDREPSLLPPAVVLREGKAPDPVLPEGVHSTVETADGSLLPFDQGLPLGVHTLRVTHRGAEHDAPLLVVPDPSAGLWFLSDTLLADEFLPELRAMRLEQDPIHRHKDVLAHTIAVVAKTQPNVVVRLAALLHDLAEPQKTLEEIRALLKSDGVLFIIEPKAADRLEDNRNALAATFYGFSLFHCMTQSLARGGPGLGTCLGPAATEALVRRSGYTRFRRLDIRSLTNLFYSAQP
jgi:hypothetical protein